MYKTAKGTAADLAVASWAIAHDIPANALKGPYWKQMNLKLACVQPGYTAMNPQKLNLRMLPTLKDLALVQQDLHLKHNPSVGRTLAGDGATKGVPLINFLIHVPGKGVTLLTVQDCSGHMSEGGTKDSL